MVFSVPQDVGTLLESNTLEEIIFAFEYHVEAWKREFHTANSNEKISDTIMEPLVLRYRVLQKLMINIKCADQESYYESRDWKRIGDDMWKAHDRYKKEHGQRYNVDMAASRVYQEEDFPIFPPKPTQSVKNQEPSDCPINEDHEHLRLLNEGQEQLCNLNEAPTSSFVYSIAENKGSECEQPVQALAEFKMHHESSHESNFNEENLSPSGASKIWTEHNSDPPLMVADVGEIEPKVNEIAKNNSSVDEPEVLHDGVKYVTEDSLMKGNLSLHLFKHVSDPPEISNGGVKCAEEMLQLIGILASICLNTFLTLLRPD